LLALALLSDYHVVGASNRSTCTSVADRTW